MRGFRLGLLFAGTAVAVVLAARSIPAYAATDGNKAIEALVPVPDTALVPPPTARDVAAPPVTPSTTTIAPVAAPADQPAATPALASLDQQVSDKLREFLTGKVDRVIERKSRPAVDAFYAARNYAPLWLDNGNANDRAKAVAAFLPKVDADGLNPADYSLPDVKPGADVAALADAELKYTATVLTYARHAQIGRVHFSRISADIAYNLVPPEPADVLGGLIDQRRRWRARAVQPSARGLQGAQGQARRGARRQGRRRAGPHRTGPGSQARRQDADAGRARAAGARAPRHCRRHL
jgi:L,D-transpeptidase YcbB